MRDFETPSNGSAIRRTWHGTRHGSTTSRAPMRAVILAGGLGTRLRPFTTLIPKPLVPLGGRYSILEVVLIQLPKGGFTHVTLSVNHLSNLIKAYFRGGRQWHIQIDKPLDGQP